MEILAKAFDALWQVLLVGLLLGVGLPALFALGVRSLNSNRQLVSVGAAGASATKRRTTAKEWNRTLEKWCQPAFNPWSWQSNMCVMVVSGCQFSEWI